MTRFYLCLFALAVSFSSFGQAEGASKIYGYKQKVRPGTVRLDENGREIQKSPPYNYFIYLASNTLVKPAEIWINGEAYRPIVNKVAVTPVEHVNAGGGSKVLVSKTNKNVLQVAPSLTRIEKPSTKGKMLAGKNELVIIYNGASKIYKPYYKALTKLKELDPLDMQ